MKFMEEELRQKLMEIPQVMRTSNVTLNIYVKEITPEIQAQIQAIMGEISFNLLVHK